MLRLNRWFRTTFQSSEFEAIATTLGNCYIDGYTRVDTGQARSPTYYFRVGDWCHADTKWFIKNLFEIKRVGITLILVWSRDPVFSIRPTLNYCEHHPIIEKKILESWDAFVGMHLKTKKSRGEARNKYRDWYQWFNQGQGVSDPIHMTPSNHPVPKEIPL